MLRFYTETEVAKALHRERRWLLTWLLEHPTDVHGKPFYIQLGRSKRFTGDDIVRLIDHILMWEEGGKRMPSGDGLIYFIQCGTRIKIGFTRAIKSRLIKMATDMPDKPIVLHTESGTFKLEKQLHRQFAAFRITGEWFTNDPVLRRYIDQRKDIAP